MGKQESHECNNCGYTYDSSKETCPKCDWLKANRRGSREAELKDSTGFKRGSTPHKSKKTYTRKIKHKSK